MHSFYKLRKSFHEFSYYCYFQCSQTNWNLKWPKLKARASWATKAWFEVVPLMPHRVPLVSREWAGPSRYHSRSLSRTLPRRLSCCCTLGCPSPHSFCPQTFHVIGQNPLRLLGRALTPQLNFDQYWFPCSSWFSGKETLILKLGFIDRVNVVKIK